MALESTQLVGAVTVGLWDRKAGCVQKEKEDSVLRRYTISITLLVAISTPLSTITGSKFE